MSKYIRKLFLVDYLCDNSISELEQTVRFHTVLHYISVICILLFLAVFARLLMNSDDMAKSWNESNTAYTEYLHLKMAQLKTDTAHTGK